MPCNANRLDRHSKFFWLRSSCYNCKYITNAKYHKYKVQTGQPSSPLVLLIVATFFLGGGEGFLQVSAQLALLFVKIQI